VHAKVNAHLFDWVVENLIRNALDALDAKGVIAVAVYAEGKDVCIDISDTGKGSYMGNVPLEKFDGPPPAVLKKAGLA
jgi:C4-dicarboxylate-specific signal transduction histidine kinase